MKTYGRDIRIESATISFAEESLSDKELVFSLLQCIQDISDCNADRDHQEAPSLTKLS